MFNSSELYPFIKYNPGKKLENLYRLYCDKATNKKKIPMLSKTLILKYAKFLGKAHTITFYVNSKEELFVSNVNEFIIELEDSGIINVKIDFKNIINIESINSLIANNVNILIKFIKSLIVNNTIELFDKLTDANIEINSITQVSNITIKGTLSLKNISNCISFLFNVIKSDAKEIIMRYKHVSNFSIMNSEESFIIELIKQKFTETEILNKLEENYKLSYDESRSKLISVINSLKLVQNTFNYKKLTIKNNPGFLTTLKKTSHSLSIIIENIDAIDYLKNINVYIDSIIKILFNQLTDTSLEKIIKNMCKKVLPKEEVEEIAHTDPIENTETIKNVAHLLENEDEDENEISSMNNDLLNILLDEDEDEDDDEDEDEDDDEEKEEEKKEEKEKEEEEKEEEEESKEEESKEEEEESKEEEEESKEDKEVIESNKKISSEEEIIKEKKIDDSKQEKEDEEEGFKEFSDKSNPILKRLINREPTLFSTDKNKFYTEYSRLCQANIKKQPVILTQEEKDIIDEKDRKNDGIKSYTESFKYATKEGNTYHYICPRYWDLEKNVSLSHEEVLSEKYGKVITKKNKDGTYDGNIMEFTDPKHHLDEKGNYINHVPGFLDEKHNRTVNKNSFCLPCCFNNKLWTKPQQEQRRSKCINSDYKFNDEQKKENFNYVKGPEKFPLEKNKLGFLPISIQKLLQFDL